MDIKYELKIEDIWEFNKYVIKNVPLHRRIFITNMMIIPIIILIVGLFMKFNTLYLISAVVISTVLYYYLAMALMKRKVVKLNKKNKGLIGEQEMVLSNSGVRVKKLDRDNMTSWKEINSIIDWKSYIYFFITDQFAYIIPKKSFSSESEAEEFLKSARALMEKNTKRK
jgi:hypothetical protein